MEIPPDKSNGETAYRIVESKSAATSGDSKNDDLSHCFTPNGRRGPSLEWKGVNFTVAGLVDNQGREKPILSNVEGKVKRETVCAILGPSGAGKSSLLNVLAGRSATRGKVSVSGEFLVDDCPVDPGAFRRNVAYVMQDDALLPTATPREALTFSATLRLADSNQQAIEKLVTRMLEELNLTECAEVMIGGEMIKGISGGQRKRTSVGVELVTSPNLIFLDEPTSGLDSESALSCVRLLSSIAQKGSTILCTIHQPNSEVFELFDSVMLLKDGECMYQGATKAVCETFTQRGFPVPIHHNPADFIMSVACNHDIPKLKDAGFFARGETTEKTAIVRTVSTSPETQFTAASTFAQQLYCLLRREAQANYRDKAALIGRYGVTIFLNLLFGLIFEGSGDRDDAKLVNLSSHFGSIVMVTIGSMFGTAQPVMLSFPLERPIFLREYTTGTYGVIAYFLAKAAVELPLALIQTIVAYALVYPLLGLQGDFASLVACAWLLGIASSSVGVVLGCCVPNVAAVAELAPAVFVPQLLFSGFFVRIKQIPLWLRWCQYLCSLKYTLNLILLIEFSDCGANSADSDQADQNCEALLDDTDVSEGQWYLYLTILIVLFFAFRTLGAIVLMQKAKSFY